MGMAITAMRKAIKAAGGNHHDPLTMTAHFLSKSEPGIHVDIPVEISKIGRKFSTVKASFIQDGNTKISFIATFGSLKELNGSSFNRKKNGFETMPKLRHVVEVTNPKTKVKSEILLEGLQNFLE